MHYPLLCRTCREPIRGQLQRHIYDMHDDCYVNTGIDRFRELPPGTRPKNVRRLVRVEYVADNRYQAIWEEL